MIDLADPALFGNDAGEDEDPAVLASYFVDKPSFVRFHDREVRLAIIRARKGMGKSALLAKVAHDREATDEEALVVKLRGVADLTAWGPVTGKDPAALVNQWQQRLCACINLELGRRLKIALDDATMIMVNDAELAGLRRRNVIGALLDRLKMRVGPVELQRVTSTSPSNLLRNYASDGRLGTVVLIIDDIDFNFPGTVQAARAVAAFFSACRKIVKDIDGIQIRLSVRTDVWTTIARIDESLDKCEQYVTDLSWDSDEMRRILSERVSSYIQRHDPELRQGATNVLNLVFPERWPWSTRTIPPPAAIFILSGGRPRWAGQLCRLAGAESAQRRRPRIEIRTLRSVMRPFGALRLDDLYREHQHQYPLLRELIESFSGKTRRYETADLLSHVEIEFLSRLAPTARKTLVDGHLAATTLTLAHFLFRIGFISGRDASGPDGGTAFVSHSTRPDLLRHDVNLDDGMSWEVHPSYRTVLRIQGTPKEQLF